MERGQEKVKQTALKFFQAWEDLEDRERFKDLHWGAVKEILETEGVSAFLTSRDVSDVLINVSLYTDRDLDQLSESDRAEYVLNRLLTVREYTALFPLYDVLEVPTDLRMGEGQFVSFDGLPDEVKDQLRSIWLQEFRRRPGIFRTEEEYYEDREESAFLEFHVDSAGPQKALDIASEKADDALNILRLLYGSDFRLSVRLVYSLPQVLAQVPGREQFMVFRDWAREQVESLSRLLTKDRPNELEGRLARALRIYGLGESTRRPEIRFMMRIVGLESMLLGPEDRDFLGHRLAEKVAFLLEDERDPRLEMYNRVKRLYGKRSGFVHRGEGTEADDLGDAEDVYVRTFRRLHDLVAQGYTSVPIINEKKAVDRLVRDLRFQ